MQSALYASDSMLSVTNKALVTYIQEDNFAGFQNFLDGRRQAVDDRDEVSCFDTACFSATVRF